MTKPFSPAITRHLGNYVYLYIDPLDDKVFYVGKGRSNRAFEHLSDERSSAKAKRIAEIRARGQEPRIEILVHGLKDEAAALKIEASIIDLLGREALTNSVRGYQSKSHGRMTLDQIRSLYGAKPAKIIEPVMLIRINQLYRHTMSPIELYEATRGYWRVGEQRKKAKYAMAVYEKIIREVYEIQDWFPSGSTFMATRVFEDPLDPKRWEFVGRVAQDAIRDKYLQRSVFHYYPKPTQSPITYLNTDKS
jgi:hypothetical protein